MTAPILPIGADEWFAAFWELGNDRQIGMSLGPIPSASIDRWCDREGYTDQETADFRRCIRAMDAEFIGKDKEPISEDGMDALLGGLAKA